MVYFFHKISVQYYALGNNNQHMSSILLYHHLGLGDHFMCHGIVREYCKKYSQVTIFCYPHNYLTVSFMYRDVLNLTIIKSDDSAAKELISKNASHPQVSKYDEVKILGFQNLDKNTGIPLEWQFYQLAGVPIDKKWSSFFIDRDFKKEQDIFEKITPKTDYVFIHDDAKRGYSIKRGLISKNYIQLTPVRSLTENIIDYCMVIEKAKEVHVIDSSFMFLIDCLPYHNPDQKLYVHRYARDNNEWQLPILKKDWRIFIQPHDKREPLKDFLQWVSDIKTPLLDGTLNKRAVRKIFTVMGWSMMRPKNPDLKAIVQRHVSGKSFIEISYENEKSEYVLIAQATGATTAISNTLEEATPTDIVFYSGVSLKGTDLISLLKQLHSITKETLVLHTINIKPETLESSLEEAGFSVREKHLFPSEMCFVCRVTQNK